MQPLEDATEEISSTEQIIAEAYDAKQKKSIILDPLFLNDEHLTEEERVRVLDEVFSRNIRKKQIQSVASYLAPLLDGDLPYASLIYGPTGSGKTVTLMHVLDNFQKVAQAREVKFSYVYVNVTSPKTHFAALNELAMAIDPTIRKYRRGIPVEMMQHTIIEVINQHQGFLCLLIDEVDNIRPTPDLFLTFLVKTLPRKIRCKLILIMLTNRMDWDKDLDPRLLSILKKEDIIFEPYNAVELLEILKLRVEKALDHSKVQDSALRKMAAYASRETGDARKAVRLLTQAARIAEESSGQLTEAEVDQAEYKIEIDKTEQLIKVLAMQQRMTLDACYGAMLHSRRTVQTGDAYQAYRRLCHHRSVRPLTQRRFSDMVSYLDLYGLLNARVVSKGRYGNTREITRSLPAEIVKRILDIPQGFLKG